jgi:hypothetical protein
MAPLFLKTIIILTARAEEAGRHLSNQPISMSNQASRAQKPLLSLDWLALRNC